MNCVNAHLPNSIWLVPKESDVWYTNVIKCHLLNHASVSRTKDQNLTEPSIIFYDYILSKSHAQIQMHKLCLKTYILQEYMEGNYKLLAEVSVKITSGIKIMSCSSLLNIRGFFKKL